MDKQKLHLERQARYSFMLRTYNGTDIAQIVFEKMANGSFERHVHYYLYKSQPETVEFSNGQLACPDALLLGDEFLQPHPDLVQLIDDLCEKDLFGFPTKNPRDPNPLLNDAKVEIFPVDIDHADIKITMQGNMTFQAPIDCVNTKELEEALRILINEKRLQEIRDWEAKWSRSEDE